MEGYARGWGVNYLCFGKWRCNLAFSSSLKMYYNLFRTDVIAIASLLIKHSISNKTHLKVEVACLIINYYNFA